MKIILDLERYILNQVLEGLPCITVQNQSSEKLEFEGAYGDRTDIRQRCTKWQQEWKGRDDEKNIEKEDKTILGEMQWKSRGYGINQNWVCHLLVMQPWASLSALHL